ncbi:hypothetical protein LN042_23875 [Kitasatospora sp. RB6PN24]|uniref:DNA polymerase Y family protein n=1 Tax=Kitasatospora humi TaxID=2893891 RepID=UPI001E2C0907|nr:hypothetical protein [Kitasatospora humi]MCC9310069.1 hypothetical protein [Kitasatospora humi]
MTTAVSTRVLYLRFHPPTGRVPEDAEYGRLLDLLTDFTPIVQALPPDAALADVAGALRYWRTDPAGLASLIRVRALALHGTDVTIGAAANPQLARLAAHTQPRGGLRVLPPEQVPAFLASMPPTALPGIGTATARTLAQLGLTTVGAIAATPLATLQRALGAGPGLRLHQHAHGIDRSIVVTGRPEPVLAVEHDFDYDELDPAAQRRALLSLAHDLGHTLRGRRQTAGALTLTVRYADQATTTRTRRLAEPSAHSPTLAEAAYRLHTGLGLQRARVRSLTLRADHLDAADRASHQLTLDGATEQARHRESAADRAHTRYGRHAITPAAVLTPSTRSRAKPRPRPQPAASRYEAGA